jgi:hypothetical protein
MTRFADKISNTKFEEQPREWELRKNVDGHCALQVLTLHAGQLKRQLPT